MAPGQSLSHLEPQFPLCINRGDWTSYFSLVPSRGVLLECMGTFLQVSMKESPQVQLTHTRVSKWTSSCVVPHHGPQETLPLHSWVVLRVSVF